MAIKPVIIGRGRSGRAIEKSLAILNTIRPELGLQPALWLDRGASLAIEKRMQERTLLCIANPHALHAGAILAAEWSGYDAILCEKPSCVSLTQLQELRAVKTPTAILHVYRQTWGIQTLKAMIAEGQLGDIITIEGRYWQASTAERALASVEIATGWKDNPELSGTFDTYLDTGTHWVDAVSFLLGSPPQRIRGWRSYHNANSPHRDSHVQLCIDYAAGGRAFGSISKTVHGADNHFEVNIIGSKACATWKFLQPDQIIFGRGRSFKTLIREDCSFGARQPPYHGTGWLEGYIEIASSLLDKGTLAPKEDYPSLQTNLDLLESMFQVEWA